MAASSIPRSPEEARAVLRDRLSEAQSLASEADQRLRELVSERPLVVLGCTVLAGYLIGRLLRR